METGGLACYKTWLNPPFPLEMPIPSPDHLNTVISTFSVFALILLVIWTILFWLFLLTFTLEFR